MKKASLDTHELSGYAYQPHTEKLKLRLLSDTGDSAYYLLDEVEAQALGMVLLSWADGERYRMRKGN